MEGKRTGAIELGAMIIAGIGQYKNMDADASDFEELPNGVAMTVGLPSGDRYRVIVEWIGDNESV